MFSAYIVGNLLQESQRHSGVAMQHDHGILLHKACSQFCNGLPGSSGCLSKLLPSLQPAIHSSQSVAAVITLETSRTQIEPLVAVSMRNDAGDWSYPKCPEPCGTTSCAANFVT